MRLNHENVCDSFMSVCVFVFVNVCVRKSFLYFGFPSHEGIIMEQNTSACAWRCSPEVLWKASSRGAIIKFTFSGSYFSL